MSNLGDLYPKATRLVHQRTGSRGGDDQPGQDPRGGHERLRRRVRIPGVFCQAGTRLLQWQRVHQNTAGQGEYGAFQGPDSANRQTPHVVDLGAAYRPGQSDYPRMAK